MFFDNHEDKTNAGKELTLENWGHADDHHRLKQKQKFQYHQFYRFTNQRE